MRYGITRFSTSMIGVWDNTKGEFIKNPSGRRKLFYRYDSAQRCADEMNEIEHVRQVQVESDAAVERIEAAFQKLESVEASYRKHFGDIPPLASRM